jgi:hypothetical protein
MTTATGRQPTSSLLLLLATNKQQTIPAIKICGRVSLVVPHTS